MNNKRILLSVIIPVYNAGKLLERCINSILEQTYDNFELILINDGSTDESPQILNEYAQKEQRIKIFHTGNKGVSSARNSGLKESSGDYVTFIDADDWIEPHWFEYCVDIINTHNVEIVRSGYYWDNEEKSQVVVCKKDMIVNDYTQMFLLNEEYKYYGYIWNTFFKKSIIKDIKFDESLNWLEDHLFTYETYLRCKKMYISCKPFYHHIIWNTHTLSYATNPYVVKAVAEKELLYKLQLVKYNTELSHDIYNGYRGKIVYSIKTCYLHVKNFCKRKRFYNHFSSLEGGEYSKTEKMYKSRWIPFFIKDFILKNKFRNTI